MTEGIQHSKPIFASMKSVPRANKITRYIMVEAVKYHITVTSEAEIRTHYIGYIFYIESLDLIIILVLLENFGYYR